MTEGPSWKVIVICMILFAPLGSLLMMLRLYAESDKRTFNGVIALVMGGFMGSIYISLLSDYIKDGMKDAKGESTLFQSVLCIISIVLIGLMMLYALVCICGKNRIASAAEKNRKETPEAEKNPVVVTNLKKESQGIREEEKKKEKREKPVMVQPAQKTVKCPYCGGISTITPTHSVCEYCGSPLEFKKA